MKAAVFQGPGVRHQIETVAVPDPGARQVLLRVERCGVCGSDVSQGKPRTGPNPLGPAYDQLFAPGRVLGHEYAGTVVALGADVKRLKVGDRVAPLAFVGCSSCLGCLSGNPMRCQHANMLMGGYAEFALAHEDFSVVMPPEVPVAAGGLIEPMATSLHTVALAELKPNANIVVIGAGTLGLGIIHFARKLGAGTIAAVARSESRRSISLEMGADFYLTQRERLAEELADLMGGPADVVFEAGGAPGLVGQAVQCVRPGGTVIVAGISWECEPTYHPLALQKEVRIQYAAAYLKSEVEAVVREARDPVSRMHHIAAHTTSLADFPAVFDALVRGEIKEKVVLDPTRG